MFGARYEVVGPLGQGGMGMVHEAIDRQLQRRVAIKTILEPARDRTARERFLREARAAAAISHPNVCQIHEISEHDGQPFLVMELLQGEALSEHLARGPLPAVEAVSILRSVLNALGALHAKSLVHRDLKPSNIFLTPHGVKLLDFGLARAASAGDTATAANLTEPGSAVGTWRYMAPEQVWYDVENIDLPDHFDLVLCDGPAVFEKWGDPYMQWRYGVLPVLSGKGVGVGEILLDDATEARAANLLVRWQQEFGMYAHVVQASDGDYAIVNRVNQAE